MAHITSLTYSYEDSLYAKLNENDISYEELIEVMRDIIAIQGTQIIYLEDKIKRICEEIDLKFEEYD